jgi:hypothetical protein
MKTFFFTEYFLMKKCASCKERKKISAEHLKARPRVGRGENLPTNVSFKKKELETLEKNEEK